MSSSSDIWAVVPIKELDGAKQRLAPLLSPAQSGVNAPKTSGALTYNALTGTLAAAVFSGAGTSLTGTASSLTAGGVTTNANLTGPVTSTGNATTITAASVTNAMLAGSIDGGKISGGTFGAVNGSALTALNAGNITASTTAGRNVLNVANPSAVSFIKLAADNTASTRTVAQTRSDLALPYVLLQDQKASGTHGGGFTSGAWQTRDVAEVTDASGICSVSSNAFTLAAGTYRIKASAPAWSVNENRAKLYNDTDSSDVLFGTSEAAKSIFEVTTRSEIVGVFTTDGTKAFTIRHRCATTANTYGYGVATGFGDIEIFTQSELWKLD